MGGLMEWSHLLQRRLFGLLAVPMLLLTQCAPSSCAPARDPDVVLGSIEIPRLGLSRVLLEGIRLETLDHGPGHWPGTAMPGEPGNVVVAGHRVSHNRDFRYIDRLRRGDEVIFHTADGRFRYVVSGADVVSGAATFIANQTAEPTATLFACHPPGSTRYRYVVHLVYAP
jgi:sortase A